MNFDHGNPLSVLFAQWPAWTDTISFIVAHHYQTKQSHDKHILVCYYKWTDEPILTTTDGQTLRSRNYWWGHATDPDAALQIVHNGGIRPAANIDESNVAYHWCPSFYCRIDGSNIHGSVHMDSYVQVSLATIQHTRRHSKLDVRPYIFHDVAKCRQEQHLRLPSPGVPAEYTASLYFDVIHGHEKVAG